MKIIYAGTPDFAVPALKAILASEHELVAVYTQPDRPAGRGRKLTASPVKKVALENELLIRQPETLRNQDAQTELEALGADLMIVAAYGLILPEPVLRAPRYGCINIHASLLPRWRGAAPIQRAIAAGDVETGITIMQMARGLDTGDILLQQSISILADDTGSTVHDQLAELGAETIMSALVLLKAGELTAEPQDPDLVTYADKLSKSEAQIDWSESAQAVVQMILAFNAWPVAQTKADGQVLRIWRAKQDTEASSANEPGKVLTECPKRGIQVGAGKGSVWLTEIQVPGKKPMLARDFLNGRSLLGERLE